MTTATLTRPAALKSPALWRTKTHLHELFGAKAARIACTRRHFNFRYRSAAHWVQVFRDFYGLTHKARAALDAQGCQALEGEITQLIDAFNVGGPSSPVVPSDYLEVVVRVATPS